MLKLMGKKICTILLSKILFINTCDLHFFHLNNKLISMMKLNSSQVDCLSVHMGLVATKPAFRVSDIASLKPVSSATETSQEIENLLVASLEMILSNKRILKALNRLRKRAVWSAPLLFTNTEDRFSRAKAQMHYVILSTKLYVSYSD